MVDLYPSIKVTAGGMQCGKTSAVIDDIINIIRYSVRPIGWAIGVHGSLVRDIDLIAVPWRDGHVSPEDLVRQIAMATGYDSRGHLLSAPRPGGRRSIILIHPMATFVQTEKGTWTPPAIDLSIMPDYRAEEVKS